VAGNLQVISVAGGLLHLSQPLDPDTRASLMFLSDGGPVLGTAEMLSPLSRTQQVFQFVVLDQDDQSNLRLGIQSPLIQNSDEDLDCQVSIGAYSSGAATTKRSHEDSPWISCIRNTRCSQRSTHSSFPITEMTTSHTNIRRWQRYPVDLPVRILPCSRLPAIAVTGRGTELSQGGMALYTGVDMEPDDLMEVEFLSPHPFKVMATVRNRSGHHFGLEFLGRL
jgi:hypothetical protein